MAEPKWSPGPWIADGDGVYVLQPSDPPWYDKTGKRLDENRFWLGVQGLKCPPDERRANAHLIASAPDLYEALERLVMAQHADRYPVDQLETKWQQALSALAKARGEQ